MYVVVNIQKVVFKGEKNIQKVVYNIQKVVFRAFLLFITICYSVFYNDFSKVDKHIISNA